MVLHAQSTDGTLQALHHGECFGKVIASSSDCGGPGLDLTAKGPKLVTGDPHDGAEIFFPDTPAGAAGAHFYISSFEQMPTDPATPETVMMHIQVRSLLANLLCLAKQHAKFSNSHACCFQSAAYLP